MHPSLASDSNSEPRVKVFVGASEGDVNAPIKASLKSRRLIFDILITLQNLAGFGKGLSVMLSGAKHLQYLFDNEQKQILRSAQDDGQGGFFRSLLDISKAQQVVRSQKLSATPAGSGRRGPRTKLTMMAVARQGMMAAAIMTGSNENRSLMRPMR